MVQAGREEPPSPLPPSKLPPQAGVSMVVAVARDFAVVPRVMAAPRLQILQLPFVGCNIGQSVRSQAFTTSAPAAATAQPLLHM